VHLGSLSTAVAYLACVASFESKLGQLSHPPAFDLLLILVGTALIATVAGRLLAGREPPAIAREPFE